MQKIRNLFGWPVGEVRCPLISPVLAGLRLRHAPGVGSDGAWMCAVTVKASNCRHRPGPIPAHHSPTVGPEPISTSIVTSEPANSESVTLDTKVGNRRNTRHALICSASQANRTSWAPTGFADVHPCQPRPRAFGALISPWARANDAR